MIAAVRRINMITDMAEVIHTSAFSVPIAQLAYFLAFIMKCYPPDLFMTESEFTVRRTDMNRNQINNTIGIFRFVASKKHRFILPVFLPDQAMLQNLNGQ